MVVAASGSSPGDASAVFGIGIGGLEGVRDDRQMTLQQAFDGLAHVLQEMPSIGDLLRLGRGLGGRLGVGRRTVAADQFDAGMGREPGALTVAASRSGRRSMTSLVSRSTTMVP